MTQEHSHHLYDLPLKVLFLCTGNSCRSQMAHGWARHLLPSRVKPYSAGTRPQQLNPLAVEVMAEVGVDISHHHAKSIDDLPAITFDVVVTVCGHAHETCPAFDTETRIVHAGFDDPPALAAQAASHEEAMVHYRRVRDEIRAFVEHMPDNLETGMPSPDHESARE